MTMPMRPGGNPLAGLLGAMGGGGAPQGPPAPAPRGDTVSILKQMIELAIQYQQVEEDDVDKANVAKVLQQLQAMLATEQKEKESALGTTPALKFLGKQAQRGPVA